MLDILDLLEAKVQAAPGLAAHERAVLAERERETARESERESERERETDNGSKGPADEVSAARVHECVRAEWLQCLVVAAGA